MPLKEGIRWIHVVWDRFKSTPMGPMSGWVVTHHSHGNLKPCLILLMLRFVMLAVTMGKQKSSTQPLKMYNIMYSEYNYS